MVDNLRGEMGDDVEVYVEPPRRTPGRRPGVAGRARRDLDGRPPAQVPHRWRDRRRVPVRRPSSRRASTRRSTGRHRSSARPGCTTRSGTPTRRPGSSTTGSSTSCSRPASRWTGATSRPRCRRRSRPPSCPPREACASRATLVHLVRLVQRAGRPRGPRGPRPLEGRGMSCWVEGAAGSPYDVDNLPYGVFSTAERDEPPGGRPDRRLRARRGAGRRGRDARDRARLRGADAQPDHGCRTPHLDLAAHLAHATCSPTTASANSSSRT